MFFITQHIWLTEVGREEFSPSSGSMWDWV